MTKDINIGLTTGFGGELVLLHKYREGWHEMFEKHGIDKKYKIKENFEMYCHLKYAGVDATAEFVKKIKEMERG